MKIGKILLTTLVGLSFLIFSFSASAQWRPRNDADTRNQWTIYDGSTKTTIFVKNERQAKKLARKMNKIAKEDKKGFYDDGTGLCDQPGVVC